MHTPELATTRTRTELHRWSILLEPSETEFARGFAEYCAFMSPKPFSTRLRKLARKLQSKYKVGHTGEHSERDVLDLRLSSQIATAVAESARKTTTGLGRL